MMLVPTSIGGSLDDDKHWWTKSELESEITIEFAVVELGCAHIEIVEIHLVSLNADSAVMTYRVVAWVTVRCVRWRARPELIPPLNSSCSV